MKKQFYQSVFVLMMSFALTTSNNISAQEKKSASQKTLINSDGSKFISKSNLPKFSWNTTPMYYHFGDIDRVLTPEEVKFIADRTDFICIEKSHGFKLLGDTVLGTKEEATAFHNLKPDTKVLFYFNSYVAWPFTQFNKDFTPEGLASNPELKKYLVTNSKTGKLDAMENRNGAKIAYSFNVLNPDFRKWWVASVLKGVDLSGSDGVFIDRMNPSSHTGQSKENSAEIEKAKGEMMASLKEKLGSDKILIGNNASENKDVFSYCDGFMFEHAKAAWLTKESLLNEWEVMLHNAKAGKMSIYRFGAKKGPRLESDDDNMIWHGMEKTSKEQLEYFLACYLIGAQPYSYLQYNWGWNLEDGNLVDYPELKKPLGAPKGAFKRVNPNGWIFTREFQHASVWLDTDKHKAKITWK